MTLGPAIPKPPVEAVSASKAAPADEARETLERGTTQSNSAGVQQASRRALAFVIDDAGNNTRYLEAFLSFPGPLTIAVLPALPGSAETARRVRAAGKELILHQPMEALGGEDPGPGAIHTGMSLEEIRAIVEQNLDEIGPVAGMNNHQGSKITMDRNIMEVLLALCRERGIYFLDSKTIGTSAAPEAARRMGMRIGERHVFLDNEPDRESMLQYLGAGLKRARSQGGAVMIGHVWSPILAALLEEQYPAFTAQDYSLVTLSRYLELELP